MLLSIRVVTKVEGSNSGDATTTSAHLRRSDRGGFFTVYDDAFMTGCVFVCDYRSRISCVYFMDVCACLIGLVYRACCMCQVLPEHSRTGWSIRPWRTGLGQTSRTGGSL